MPILALLLQGIPEEIGVITLAYAIARIPFRWKEIIPMGIIFALIVSFIRAQNLPFGTHTIVLIFALFIFITLKGKKDVSIALVASILSFLAIIVFEVICISLLTSIFKTPNEEIFMDPVKRVLFTEPQVILLFLTAFIIRRKREPHD